MNTKSKGFKAGVSFGIGMTIFNIIMDLVVDKGTNPDVTKIIVSSIVAGVISGVLFGLITGWFEKSSFVTKGTKLETMPGETIILSTGANHFKGAEAVGGKLYLTNQRLVFRSHHFNIQNHDLSASITQITSINTFKPLGLTKNGLSVSIAGKEEKFVVEQLESWLQLLQVHTTEPIVINK